MSTLRGLLLVLIDFQELKELEIMSRICRKNGCVEGELDPKGDTITFNRTKSNGKKYVCCDYCQDYVKNTLNPKSNHKRINRFKERYPAPLKAIYALFENEKLLYIGESKRTPHRLDEHYNGHPDNTRIPKGTITVSYTHLTLPTIYSV